MVLNLWSQLFGVQRPFHGGHSRLENTDIYTAIQNSSKITDMNRNEIISLEHGELY